MRTNSAFVGIVVVMGSVVAVACSGSSTTTTGGTGTGKGLFGGTSSSSSGSTATTCAAASGDTTCSTCLKTSCCSQTTACGNDTECVAAFNCADSCTTNDCNTNCEAAHPTAQSEIDNLVTCANQKCATACGSSDTTSSSSSSTSSSGSSGEPPTFPGCLQNTPQDSGLCASGQIAVDCMNGNPAPAKCTPSPMNVGGIYCCTSVP